MPYNDQFEHGIVLEDEELHTSWTPNAGDTFNLLGTDIGANFSALWPQRQATPIFTGDKFTPDSYLLGRGIVGGQTLNTQVNGFPLRCAWGTPSTSSATGYHVHTFSIASSTTLPSTTWHFEEAQATASKSLYRDDLGCKVEKIIWEWDWLNGMPLKCIMNWVGCYERNASHATKPAVHLTTRPALHTGTTTEGYLLPVTTTWNSIAIKPTFLQFGWDNNIDSPDYQFGGIAGNDNNELWATGIKRSAPGLGEFRLHFWCDLREVQDAVVTDSNNTKTLVVKLTKPGDSTKYFQFSLAGCVMVNCAQTHAIGDLLANMVATGKVTTPSLSLVDGVTAWT